MCDLRFYEALGRDYLDSEHLNHGFLLLQAREARTCVCMSSCLCSLQVQKEGSLATCGSRELGLHWEEVAVLCLSHDACDILALG